jgi:hypothetical protein
MTDESVVMTGLDNGTPRHRVVEAIRASIERPWEKVSENPSEEAARQNMQQALQNLLNQQILKHEDRISEAREAQLTRRCRERVVKGSVQQLNVLAESDSSAHEQVMRVAHLLSDVRLEDGRIVSLSLAKEPGDKADRVQLLAITRADVALPIASMYIETDTIVFESQSWNTRGTMRDQLVKLLLARVRNEPLVIDWKTPSIYTLRAAKMARRYYNDYDVLVANYCYSLGLLKENEINIPWDRQELRYNIDKENARRELDAFFIDPKVAEKRFPEWLQASPPLQLAMARLPKWLQAQQLILEKFNIRNQLQSKLDVCTLEEERLAKQLSAMAGTGSEFSAVIKDLNTGKIDFDMTIKVRIFKQGTTYDVQLFAKPAYDQRPFEQFGQYNFDTTQPLFDRKGNSEPQIESKARQLFDILIQLEAVD